MTGKANETVTAPARFALPSRVLHWLMAPMVVVQLLLGVAMIASLSYYPLLLAIPRPLGLLILIFAVQLRWFPVYGGDGPMAIVLPAVTLGVWAMARTARITPSSMLAGDPEASGQPRMERTRSVWLIISTCSKAACCRWRANGT